MSQPRIFSLQKLVEVADFNMDSRGRIVWANVWGVLGEHFSKLGAHPNRYVGAACCLLLAVGVFIMTAWRIRYAGVVLCVRLCVRQRWLGCRLHFMACGVRETCLGSRYSVGRTR